MKENLDTIEVFCCIIGGVTIKLSGYMIEFDKEMNKLNERFLNDFRNQRE